jgi:hypothetical protein
MAESMDLGGGAMARPRYQLAMTASTGGKGRGTTPTMTESMDLGGAAMARPRCQLAMPAAQHCFMCGCFSNELGASVVGPLSPAHR